VEKPRVLFLCTGNSARSQMAEAFLRHQAGDRFEVYSAGLEPKAINPYTLLVMQEVGLNMSAHYAKPLSDYMGKMHFSYLITVCDRAGEKCPIFPGMGTRLHWSFEDPAACEGPHAEKMAKFRQVRDQIDEKVRSWLVDKS
jgi:arsenate reductase (thioredoxin)